MLPRLLSRRMPVQRPLIIAFGGRVKHAGHPLKIKALDGAALPQLESGDAVNTVNIHLRPAVFIHAGGAKTLAHAVF